MTKKTTRATAGEAPERADDFAPDPRIAELDAELERLDAERLKALDGVRRRAAKVRAERDRLIMIDQLTLRFLNASPLSGPEQEWVEANPDVWQSIRDAHKGGRGSRKPPVHATVK